LLEEMILDDTDKFYPLGITGPERDLLAEEARLGCMQTVLACLGKKTQMTYILGDVFGVTSKEGAYIFDITPETFRKRLTRGRKQLGEFMMKHCGLVNQNNSCRCDKQAGKKLGSIPTLSARPSGIERAAVVKGRAEVEACLKEISEIDRVAAMFRRYPEYRSPESFTYIVR
jgi:hypothetical protein